VDGGGTAEGIRVGAVATDDPTASSFLSVAETDAAGRFRLNNVPEGHYYIVAGRLNNLQFFPKGTSAAQATEIVVEAAKIRSDVNFTVPSDSGRPAQTAKIGSTGLNSLSDAEFQAYRAISAETNVDRRLQLLTEFESKFPKSAAMTQVLTSLLNAYVTRGNSAKATEYAEKVLRMDASNVNSLILVSRNFTILQINSAKAKEYAQKAATLTAQMKTQRPQNGLDAATWRNYTTSIDASAQANLAWVNKTADWQQQQFNSFIRPRRAN
jgi:hypothetical protein